MAYTTDEWGNPIRRRKRRRYAARPQTQPVRYAQPQRIKRVRAYARPRRRKASMLYKAQKAYFVGKAIRQKYLDYVAEKKQKDLEKRQKALDEYGAHSSFLYHKEKYKEAVKKRDEKEDYSI
jgi:hypothetical protein